MNNQRTNLLYWLTLVLVVLSSLASTAMWLYRDFLAQFPYDSF